LLGRSPISEIGNYFLANPMGITNLSTSKQL